MRGGTIVLVDGHSLFHRAFFALPMLTNSRGQPTNAVYGFLTMLLKLLEDEDPSHVAVAFDRAEPTFRHEAFDAYKAHRPEMADELRSQGPLLRRALEALRIPIFELPGYEADDVIGTLAERAAAAGCKVLILSGDRDLLQVVRPGVHVLLTRKGISETEVCDEVSVRERYELDPVQLADVKALMGDPTDNIPGVPGIGEKTALKLIKRFGSLEGLYEHLDEVEGKRTAQALADYRDQAELSKRLAVIVRDLSLAADLDECRRREPDREALGQVLKELEFRSLARRLGVEAETPAPAAACEVLPDEPLAAAWTVADPAGLDRAVAALSEAAAGFREAEVARREAAAAAGGEYLLVVPYLSGDGGAERDGPAGEALGLFMMLRRRRGDCPAFYFPFRGKGSLPRDRVLPALETLLGDPAIPKAGHAMKPFLRDLARRGVRFQGLVFDTAVAAYLIDAIRTGGYTLDDLARQYLKVELPALPDAGDAGDPGDAGDDTGRRLLARTAAIVRLRDRLAADLAERELDRVFTEIEMPLIGVLARMEAAGVLVDPAVIDRLGEEFSARAAELAGEIYRLAGMEFNVNSTQQLREVLFDRLGLPAGRKTKTGFSTDASVLEELAGVHPVAAKILEHRHLAKLQSTYVDGLRPLIDPATGRVHTTFQQTVTATGRLSSAMPNLQNIPVREEMGRRLRRAFVAPPGYALLAADYSQIELRLLAHISGDQGLIRAFHEGADIHRATAAEVFGIPREAVTDEMRDGAKAINFGIVYGISDYGLSRNLRIGRADARAFIDSYFARYPGVKRYCEEIVRRARRDGYVRTLFNRIRHLPEINSKNFARRQFAERTALNTPIQGSAADIIKLAMVRVDGELALRRLKARLILQVHDELILEVPQDEMEEARSLVVDLMEGIVPLHVPLRVDVKTGANWYDVK